MRETLTSRVLNGKRRTVAIVVTKLHAVVITEVVFGEITMQMLLAAMLVQGGG